jgi:transposase
VARRNGVARGLLTVWRHQVAAAVASEAPNFVPIQIGAESGGTANQSERISSAQTRPLEIAAPSAKACGVIEIEVSGARIRKWDGPAALPPNRLACLWGNQEKEARHATQV